MNYDRPELRDRLAAAYALGTLRGAARRRLERLMSSDATLAAAVEDWQRRLNPLVEALPPVDPPARVWAAIEREIAATTLTEQTVTRLPAGDASIALRTIALWRNFAIAATAIAAALAIYIAVERPEPGDAIAPIAVLNDDAGHAAFVASTARLSTRLVIARVGAGTGAGPQRSYQLWLLPHGGARPRSLGVIPDLRQTVFELSVENAKGLVDADGIAISLEPAGGSTTGLPTGPILFKGPVTSD